MVETATVDKRVLRSRERVITSTLELLTAGGVGAFSVDEVARRSGVAKTTIYRHWPDRSDLLVDSCRRLVAEQTAPDTGSFEGDLRAFLDTMVAALAEGWTSVLPSVVDLAERDPSFGDVHRDLQRGHAAPVRTLLERGVARGEVRADVDAEAVVAVVMGALYYRRWYARAEADPALVDGLLTAVLALGRPR